MEIRRLIPPDAESSRKLRLEALKNNPEAFASSYEEEKERPLERFKNQLEAKNSYTFGAFEQGELVGSVTLVRENHLKMKHRASVVAMYVSPERRGSGIGRKLLELATQQAREWEDVEQVYLCVVTTNEPARKLYTSLGFEPYGIEKRALKLGNQYFDEELMVLFL